MLIGGFEILCLLKITSMMWEFAPESESSLSYCCSDSERICQYLPFCDAVHRYFENEKSFPLTKKI